jgi:hypothetical protein
MPPLLFGPRPVWQDVLERQDNAVEARMPSPSAPMGVPGGGDMPGPMMGGHSGGRDSPQSFMGPTNNQQLASLIGMGIPIPGASVALSALGAARDMASWGKSLEAYGLPNNLDYGKGFVAGTPLGLIGAGTPFDQQYTAAIGAGIPSPSAAMKGGLDFSYVGDESPLAAKVASGGQAVGNNGPFGNDVSPGGGFWGGTINGVGPPNANGVGQTSLDAGGGGGPGGWVICTELNKQGLLADEQLEAGYEYMKRLPVAMVRGYRWWAVPYVRLMRRSKIATAIAAPVARWRADEILYQLGRRERGDWRGKLVQWIGGALCLAIGLFVKDTDYRLLYSTDRA